MQVTEVLETRATQAEACEVLFVGYMAGARPGYTTSQGYLLSELMRKAGCRVERVSERHNRYLRLWDVASRLARHQADSGAVIMEVYGGRNFVLVDFASALARRSGAPLVMVLHGGSLPALFRQRPAWTRRVLGRADALVAPSEYLARAVRQQHGLEIEVIPNFLTIEDYPFRLRSSAGPRLFWMRSFHEVYNPRMAVRVLKRLRERYAGATLVMAGRGQDTEACRRFAAEQGVAEAIEFPGFVNPEQKRRFAAECDIFINTSRVDNTPVAVLEACAFGMPVVSTNVGGVADLLTQGHTGLLVRDGDDAAMAEAVARLIEEPDLAAKLSAAGRRLAESCSSSAVVPRWFQVLERAQEARRRR